MRSVESPTLAPSGSNGASPVLEVSNLKVEVRTAGGPVAVVDDVSFSLARRSTLGIVGESGSGKTMTGLGILGLVPATDGTVTGRICLDGREYVAGSKEIRELRGTKIAMIFQEARRSLDPSFTVGHQIAESVRRHLGMSKRDAWARAVESLDRVHIANAEARAKEYPHMFSGGMCQRVMIALALSAEPDVLIADEATTALDVTVQAYIIDLLRELQEEMGLGLIMITHDLGVAAAVSDRVMVMYSGQVVENTPASRLFTKPEHPYTEGLLRSLPQLQTRGERLTSIPGVVPTAEHWERHGCRFRSRCAYAAEICESETLLRPIDDTSFTRCIRVEDLGLRGVG